MKKIMTIMCYRNNTDSQYSYSNNYQKSSFHFIGMPSMVLKRLHTQSLRHLVEPQCMGLVHKSEPNPSCFS